LETHNAVQVLLLVLDGKGVIISAYGSSEISDPIALLNSKELGVVGLAKTSTQTVSLFKLS
jgi:hypothetical protein